MLVSRDLHTNEILYLIPELCQATGLIPKNVQDKKMIDNLSTITNFTPALRVDKFMKLNKEICNTHHLSSKILKKWKLELHNELKPIKGRVMAKELIKFGNLKL